ncbi:MAG: hypothetical protein U1C58_07135 [Flavobacteriaceae bacterium]|nr:hypothetical protein [Flavobacteriaceae bacterium]MDZ4148040.1 hypothetical protein [Flavobacteriaceae bacterium]
MTSNNIKKTLISSISEIDDAQFLSAIQTIVDSKLKSQKMRLTAAQHQEVIESRQQIKDGLFITQTELDKEFDQWLSKR